MNILKWRQIILLSGLVLLIFPNGITQTNLDSSQSPFFEGDVGFIDDSMIEIFTETSNKYYEIPGNCALAALKIVCEWNGFEYIIDDRWYGNYGGLLVSEIAGRANDVSGEWLGWQFWPNYPDEAYPEVSADNYEIEVGDTLYWFYGGYGINPDSSDMVLIIHVIEDNSKPTASVNSPQNGGFYVYGSEIAILPFPFSITVGDLEVRMNARDELSGIKKVDISVDGSVKDHLTRSPFVSSLSGFSTGMHTLGIKIYDHCGNTRFIEMSCFLVGN